jgi:hypothetical protein
MTITEPMTLLTDYALSAVAGVLSVSLFRGSYAGRQITTKLWAGAFMAVAFVAIVGGTCHGAGYILGKNSLMILWKTTIFLSGFISFFILMAGVVACLPKTWHLLAFGIAIVKLVLYLVWMSTHNEFRYVIYDYGSAMFLALCLYAVVFIRSNQKGPRWVVGGLLLSAVAAIFQRSGLDLSTNFNHNDLYHVVQIGAIYLLYRGVKTGAEEVSMAKKA